MPATIAGSHLGPDIHANRPAANAAGQPFGALYSCTTHGLIYRTDGSTWSTYATLGGGGTLSDQGVITYLDGTVAAAPGTPAAGKLRIYAKTGKVLAIKDDAGLETVLGAGSGSDLVQTYSGGGSVYVPGLLGAPERIPASPAAADDEFNALSGWTTLGSPDTLNVTDVPSHVHIGDTNIGYNVQGIYKTCPSMPFTVTVKLTDYFLASNYVQAGILLTEASPGKLFVFGPLFGAFAASINDLAAGLWTNATTRASVNDTNLGLALIGPVYLRLIVTSGSNVTCQYNFGGGLAWHTIYSSITSGLTPANVGVAIAGNTSGVQADAYFDYIRFS